MDLHTITLDNPPSYSKLDDVHKANPVWFSSGNMRFFGTRVLERTFVALPNGDALFITSDFTGFSRVGRGYSVRHASWVRHEKVEGAWRGEMNTVEGGVSVHPTRAAAVKALRAAAADILARASAPVAA